MIYLELEIVWEDLAATTTVRLHRFWKNLSATIISL